MAKVKVSRIKYVETHVAAALETKGFSNRPSFFYNKTFYLLERQTHKYAPITVMTVKAKLDTTYTHIAVWTERILGSGLSIPLGSRRSPEEKMAWLQNRKVSQRGYTRL